MTREELRKMSPYMFYRRVGVDQDLRIVIADNMKKYGGSFVQKLGEALLLADMSNNEFSNGFKLAQAFPEYFMKYATWNDLEPVKLDKPRMEDALSIED